MTKQEEIIKSISNALDAKKTAEAQYQKTIELAENQKKLSTQSHDKKMADIAFIYGSTALKIAVIKKRYLDDDVGLPKQPDRITANLDGIRLEWEYEDRGFTETMTTIVTWPEILDFQNKV